MAQILPKVQEVTNLKSTDTLIVVDESTQVTNPSTGETSGSLRRIQKDNLGFATKTELTEAIAQEKSERTEALEDYALQNGYYDELTAGSAEQLLSSQFVEDSVPYKFRTSGGSADIGNREYDEIVGGSIVWNQLVNSSFLIGNGTYNGVTVTNNGDGTLTLNGTATNVFRVSNYIPKTEAYGHVFLMIDVNNRVKLYHGYGAGYHLGGTVVKQTTNDAMGVYCYENGTTFDNVTIKPILFDLTKKFGSQVADYIYSLEQAQSGKGVAFFKSLFPNDYYPYNAGELMSVEGLQSHDMVGFNQWDEEWRSGYYNATTGVFVSHSTQLANASPIKVLPNTTYHITSVRSMGGARIVYRDLDENLISIEMLTSVGAGNFTTPSNCAYVDFCTMTAYGGTYKNDICINLSWSGWRNGEYEPYKKYSYPLDSSLTLRGIPKVVDNEFCFDGDIYSYDGKVQRRYGVVDLGSLTWAKASSSGHEMFHTAEAFTNAKAPTSGRGNILCAKYVNSNYIDVYTHASDKAIALFTNGYLYVYDSTYTSGDYETFKTAMSGVYLIYELATPTEETATPFDEIQLVDDFGTEEYVSGNLVPVGHNTKYPANLRDKLQHLPDLPSGDGFYLIQVSGTQMTLNPFRIPMMPTTDGTYTLKCTVSGGTPTASWESEETE